MSYLPIFIADDKQVYILIKYTGNEVKPYFFWVDLVDPQDRYLRLHTQSVYDYKPLMDIKEIHDVVAFTPGSFGYIESNIVNHYLDEKTPHIDLVISLMTETITITHHNSFDDDVEEFNWKGKYTDYDYGKCKRNRLIDEILK